MRRIAVALLLATTAVTTSACGPSALDWRNHTSLRSTGPSGKDVTAAHVDPTETGNVIPTCIT
jgi:hypothetical protein